MEWTELNLECHTVSEKQNKAAGCYTYSVNAAYMAENAQKDENITGEHPLCFHITLVVCSAILFSICALLHFSSDTMFPLR